MEKDSSRELFVSIIIPVRNAGRTINKTMASLAALDYPSERLEIILVDGGSTDETLDIIQGWQERLANLCLLRVPGCKSPGQARNAALKVARGEFILFTDGDCAAEPDWIRKILGPFFLDEKIGAVGGEILTLRTDPDNITESYCEQTGFLRVSGRCDLRESGYFPWLLGPAPHEVNGGNYSPFFATANIAFRRSCLEDVGGGFWDEPTGEDVDLCLRLLKRGYRLYFAAEAVVRHMHRVSLESYVRQWYGYGYGHPLLIREHAASQLEIVLQLPRPLFIAVPSPYKGIIHLGAFQLMHLFLTTTIATGLGAALGWFTTELPAASLILLAGSLLAYFSPCLKLRPTSKILDWCRIRYLTNWAFIRGALDGTRKFGALCIEPSW